MVYLKSFTLLDDIGEHNIVCGKDIRRIHNNYYPLHIFSNKDFKDIAFDNITIFYGGNGSGKTTLLNIIAEKLEAIRKNKIDKGSYFNLYVNACGYNMIYEEPFETKVISSDDVFDYLLNIRAINTKVNRNKERLSREYLSYKFNSNNNFENYDDLKNKCDSQNKTMSKFIRERMGNNNIIEQSNGESALMYWEQEINEDGLYILDEPENSLSAENQLKLKKFIEDSVRFFNCQFIISTHSPFLLNLEGAKIYDLDEVPVVCKKWTELDNVKTYYNFFKEHKDKFEN